MTASSFVAPARVRPARSSIALFLVASASPPAIAQVSLADQPGFAALHRAVPDDLWDWGVELADFDGDGDLDAVRGTRPPGGPPELVLLENDGHALFRERSRYPWEASDFSLADLDGDGDSDVLGVSIVGLLVLENVGGGTFELSEIPHVLPATSVSRSLVLADVEQDRDLDVLFVTSHAVVLVRRHGAAFGAPEILASVSGSDHVLAAADFDQDGDVDLAHTGAGSAGRSLALLLNDGGGSYSPGPIVLRTVAPILGLSIRIASGDVDGNGTVDLFFADWNLHLFLNRGGGVFSEAPERLPSSDYVLDLLLADLDGNRSLDLSFGWGLYLNDGLGFFKDASRLLPGGAGEAAAGDLDRDGDVDLCGNSSVALQDQLGRFHDPDLTPSSGPLARELEDLDGDGDLDVLGLANDGRGVFVEVTGAVPGGLGIGRARFGDFDGDGDPDAFVPSSRPFFHYPEIGDHWIRNAGDGRFSSAGVGCEPSPSAEIELTMDGAVGDVDADGDLDLFLARVAPGFACHRGPCYDFAPSRLWENDGAGCFVDGSAALPSVPFERGFAVDLGDVDADGDLDALTSESRLYRNEGGVFVDAGTHLEPGLALRSVALGDMDGDGDLDAFYSVSSIALNDGTGGFPAIVTGPLDSSFPGFRTDLWLGDLNDDGRLDAVEGLVLPTGRFFFPVRESVQPFLNRGNVTFEPLAFPPSFSARFDVGDVDQDGDLDLFDGHVFTNLTRSLAWRAHPRIGHPLVLELAGAAHAPFLLALSSSVLPPRPTRFGLLRLDLADVFFVSAGALDADGREALSFDLPRDPALVGRTAYAQALIGASPLLSNLEVIEIAGF